MTRLYRGLRNNKNEAVVGFIDTTTNSMTAQALSPRFDLRYHSPSGFEWGYSGSGPAQLSLALLADALGDDARAQRLYQAFKFAAITGLEREHAWTITRDVIVEWADRWDAGEQVKILYGSVVVVPEKRVS